MQTSKANKLYKADLAKTLSERTDLSFQTAGAIVKVIFDALSENLAEGKDVSIFGFGSFNVVTRKSRNGINPSTREFFVIPARKAVSFKPSSVLKTMVKDSGTPTK